MCIKDDTIVYIVVFNRLFNKNKMEFFKKPKTDSHKKALWLIAVFVVIIAISFLWNTFSGLFTQNSKTYSFDENVANNKVGDISIPTNADIAAEKTALFARLSKIKTQPLNADEKKYVTDNFSNAVKMKLTESEKTQIINALNSSK